MDEPFVYLNGQYLPRSQAKVDIEDRGFLFADGVYEVVHYYGGRPFGFDGHMKRLHHSLEAIKLDPPADVARLGDISLELIRRNNLPDTGVYWHITRGPAPRAHAFPAVIQPTVLVITYPVTKLDPNHPVTPVRCKTVPDVRWEYCCYKTLMLLANVLAKEEAHRAGCAEAILHRRGVVTEGSSTNVMIVKDGCLRTHPANQWILHGVTRAVILELAQSLGVRVVEEAFPVADLFTADEVMITGSTTEVAAVVEIDGRKIADGQAGKVTAQLYRAFIQRVGRECGV